LFDVDKVARPLLGLATEDFFNSVQEQWAWNSRYWEQRALLVAETDPARATQHARHAVAIERHSYPLTTLGKILFMEMENSPQERERLFREALDVLCEAIDAEAQRYRVTVHPYAVLLAGTSRFLELGGSLSSEQRRRVTECEGEAQYRFSGDPLVEAATRRLDGLLT
jgi:hypothetical protein